MNCTQLGYYCVDGSAEWLLVTRLPSRHMASLVLLYKEHSLRHVIACAFSLVLVLSLCFPRTRGHVCDLSFSLSRSSSCTLGCTSLSRSLSLSLWARRPLGSPTGSPSRPLALLVLGSCRPSRSSSCPRLLSRLSLSPRPQTASIVLRYLFREPYLATANKY